MDRRERIKVAKGIHIYRRGTETWHCDLHVGGKRPRRSLGTSDEKVARQEALKFAVEFKQEVSTGYTFQHAITDWLNAGDRGATDLSVIKKLKEKYPNRPINQVTSQSIALALQDLKPGNYNRHIGVVAAAMNLAVEHGHLTVAPKFKKRKEPPGIVRFLTKAEWARLYAALPDYLKAPTSFALYTGLRKANVLLLRWEQVDMRRKLLRVDAADFKNRTNQGFPLGEEAMAILKEQVGKHDEYVFVYPRWKRDEDGKHPLIPVGDHKRAWATAKKAAKVVNFRWHDLRHSWASWMAMAGVSLKEIQELGGWATATQPMRYMHLSKGHVAGKANTVGKAMKGKK